MIEPDVLLLDEPLSALDANLREEMRVEIKNIQRRIGVATVFVTHDQGEALAMSDIVVVMNKGKIEQMGAPPRSMSIRRASSSPTSSATPISSRRPLVGGDARAIQCGSPTAPCCGVGGGATREVRPGDTVKVVVRAEKVVLGSQGGLSGKIVDVDYLGALARYEVDLAGGQRLRRSSLHEKVRSLGETVGVGIDPEHCRIL